MTRKIIEDYYVSQELLRYGINIEIDYTLTTTFLKGRRCSTYS